MSEVSFTHEPSSGVGDSHEERPAFTTEAAQPHDEPRGAEVIQLPVGRDPEAQARQCELLAAQKDAEMKQLNKEITTAAESGDEEAQARLTQQYYDAQVARNDYTRRAKVLHGRATRQGQTPPGPNEARAA